MPEKREYMLTLSPEEVKETNDLINTVIVTLAKQAAKLTEMYDRSDPNMTMLIFEHLLQNFMLNLLNRVHKITNAYCFDVQNIIDEQMIKNGEKKPKTS